MVLPKPHPHAYGRKLRTLLPLAQAAGIVSAAGFIMPKLDARPVTSLMGLAVAVVLAALVTGRQGAWLAIALGAVLGALQLPPSASMYIDPKYQLGYGLFLALCVLTSLYYPPRSSIPLQRAPQRAHNRHIPYTEADLPTLAPLTQGIVEKQTCEVAGLDIYKWERACAHLCDVLADTQNKLQENDRISAHHLLQHAYEVADDTRKHIQKTDIFMQPLPDHEESLPVPE